MIKLFHGDCLQILKDISSNSVDLIVCDLPFGCLGVDRRSQKVKASTPDGGTYGDCPWDVKIDLEAFWSEIRRIRKDDHSPCLHFCTTKYGFDLWESNKKEFRYDLVWDKGRGVSFLSANKMPMRSHEMIYVFSKAGASYKRIDISGTPSTSRCVLSVIECPTAQKKGGHPTEKSVDLYKFLIQRFCPVGGTVLDPTFGSGNSGQASKELGRNYIGIEKDKGFYEKAKKKLCPEENSKS